MIKRHQLFVLLSFFIIAALVVAGCTQANTEQNEAELTDEEKVKQAIHGYYGALAEGDIDTAIQYVHNYDTMGENQQAALRSALEDLVTGEHADTLPEIELEVEQVGFQSDELAVAMVKVSFDDQVNQVPQFVVLQNGEWKLDIENYY